MTVSYDFYTSSSRTGKVALKQRPATGLWVEPVEWAWRYPHKPSRTIPSVVRRKPKKDRWEKYTEGMKKIRKIKEITEVTRHIEIRPVIICGWCGARIPRGMEDEPCEYCGS